jgi:hypothetical protein
VLPSHHRDGKALTRWLAHRDRIKKTGMPPFLIRRVLRRLLEENGQLSKATPVYPRQMPKRMAAAAERLNTCS